MYSIKMDYTLDTPIDISVVAALCTLSLILLISCFMDDYDTEAVRVFKDIKVLSTRIDNLLDCKFENPYDLFVHMYPSLKDMDNERIDELIQLMDTYNKNWVEQN